MSNQVLEQEEIESNQEIKAPKKYMVVLINDDFTPIDFVVYVMIIIFNKNVEEATAITLDVHEKGEGVCGKNYSLEIAKNKVNKVTKLARSYNYPLKCEYREQK